MPPASPAYTSPIEVTLNSILQHLHRGAAPYLGWQSQCSEPGWVIWDELHLGNTAYRSCPQEPSFIRQMTVWPPRSPENRHSPRVAGRLNPLTEHCRRTAALQICSAVPIRQPQSHSEDFHPPASLLCTEPFGTDIYINTEGSVSWCCFITFFVSEIVERRWSLVLLGGGADVCFLTSHLVKSFDRKKKKKKKMKENEDWVGPYKPVS